ncbi:MAG: AmmeMemoRadiSam system radical SAM enzyme, partial [Candidatus Bathyarchaeia archaeon]
MKSEAKEAMFYERLEGNFVKCNLCSHRCKIADSKRGVCAVRENRGGTLYSLVYGKVVSQAVDPIEKKPLFHFRPGTRAFSFATAGCNVECRFCQNWSISQRRPEQVESLDRPPDVLAAAAAASGAASIAATYTEPVIFTEYVRDVALAARRRGVATVVISNGYIQEAPLKEMATELAAIKIDLKAFTEKFYREVCSGELKPVLATLQTLARLKLWTEIVVLILPTLNDDPAEIRQMAAWVRDHMGPDVPVHFTRFHPTYKLRNLPPTPVSTLERCRNEALAAGLRFVYLGNVPGHRGQNTYC